MNKDRKLRKVVEQNRQDFATNDYLSMSKKEEEEYYQKAMNRIKALYKPLGKEELEGLANDIELKVMAEITDRRGFRQEWDCMDKDIQNEIEETLIDIISQAIINARGE